MNKLDLQDQMNVQGCILKILSVKKAITEYDPYAEIKQKGKKKGKKVKEPTPQKIAKDRQNAEIRNTK